MPRVLPQLKGDLRVIYATSPAIERTGLNPQGYLLAEGSALQILVVDTPDQSINP